MTKVSVIIPCYNYAGYLPDAVGSVLAQTYRDFEIIIVDDGSTDDTKEVAHRLIDENPGVTIKLVEQENRGLPAARNAGIAAAEGEYILPLDADDMILPGYLEETAMVLDEDGSVSIAYTNYTEFGQGVEGTAAPMVTLEYDLDELITRNTMPVCSLFRKAAWAEVGGYKNIAGYHDWEFWISLGEAGHYGRLIDKPLFLYRKHGHSMIDESMKMHEELFAKIRSYHPRLYGTEGLNKVVAARGRIIREQADYIKWVEKDYVRLRAYVDEIHTLKGFTTRVLKALLRRAGLLRGGR